MAQLPTLDRLSRGDLIAAPISAFESDTQAVILKTSPYSQHAILHVMGGMIVLVLALMCFVKLDRVVNSAGRILPTQGSFFVQPLDRAIVTAILAHPGDVVRKGQVLATLDPTFAQADLRDLQQKQASEEALVARLKAEQAGKPYVADPAAPDPLQASIFDQRQAEYQQSINDFDARIQADQAVIARNRQDAVDYQQRLALAAQAEQTQVELQQQGFGRRLEPAQLLRRPHRDATHGVGEPKSAMPKAQHDAAALSAQRAVFIGKWRDDVATQLVTAQERARRNHPKPRQGHQGQRPIHPGRPRRTPWC